MNGTNNLRILWLRIVCLYNINQQNNYITMHGSKNMPHPLFFVFSHFLTLQVSVLINLSVLITSCFCTLWQSPVFAEVPEVADGNVGNTFYCHTVQSPIIVMTSSSSSSSVSPLLPPPQIRSVFRCQALSAPLHFSAGAHEDFWWQESTRRWL
jgi:hypothetical protein